MPQLPKSNQLSSIKDIKTYDLGHSGIVSEISPVGWPVDPWPITSITQKKQPGSGFSACFADKSWKVSTNPKETLALLVCMGMFVCMLSPTVTPPLSPRVVAHPSLGTRALARSRGPRGLGIQIPQPKELQWQWLWFRANGDKQEARRLTYNACIQIGMPLGKPYHVIQDNAIPDSTLPYNSIRYNTMDYNSLQHDRQTYVTT